MPTVATVVPPSFKSNFSDSCQGLQAKESTMKKHQPSLKKRFSVLICVVGGTGLEPVTPGL